MVVESQDKAHYSTQDCASRSFGVVVSFWCVFVVVFCAVSVVVLWCVWGVFFFCGGVLGWCVMVVFLLGFLFFWLLVWWVFLVCFCGGLLCCFCGGFVVRLGWCFCGGVLVVFLCGV